MPSPAVSVVIPAYNAASTIRETILSVLAQRHHHVEIVVVDDGSTDNTAALLQTFAGKIVVITQENRGVGHALNTGLHATTAPLVSMLGADDIWLPQYLDCMIATLKANPHAAIAHTDAWMFDEAHGRIARASAMEANQPQNHTMLTGWEFFRALMQRNFIFYSALAQRDTLERLGFCDPALRSAEDYDLWLRAALAGHQFVYVPDRLAVYRIRPHSLSRRSVALQSSVVKVYRKIALSRDTPAHARKLAVTRLRAAEAELSDLLVGPKARRHEYIVNHLRHLKGRLQYPTRWYVRTPREVRSVLPDLLTRSL